MSHNSGLRCIYADAADLKSQGQTQRVRRLSSPHARPGHDHQTGSPAAGLICADEWESIQETLFWLSQPGIRDTIAEADADIAAGRTDGEDTIRANLGVPKRHS